MKNYNFSTADGHHRFTFPISGGHKYNKLWEWEHLWWRYSVSNDAAFCSYRVLFGEQSSGKGVQSTVFHTRGFRNWKNAKGTKRGALLSHETSELHKDAAMKALACGSAEAYYRRNVYYPFIDHCETQFSECFPDSLDLSYFQTQYLK